MLKIKELCRERGITQKDLAQALDTTELSIRRASAGNTSIPMMKRIADALGVTIAELFEEQPAPEIRCPHCGKRLELKAKE